MEKYNNVMQDFVLIILWHIIVFIILCISRRPCADNFTFDTTRTSSYMRRMIHHCQHWDNGLPSSWMEDWVEYTDGKQLEKFLSQEKTGFASGAGINRKVILCFIIYIQNMYYLIHTIYGPFQRYLFTILWRQQHMVRDIAFGEDSKRTFQGWSMVIIARRKTTKRETVCLKTTIYSRREILNSVLPAMPQATGYQRPRVINLLQSSPSSQLGTPRESYSGSILCCYPWGSDMSQCDFLI